jgi:hypothetical protein
MEGRFGEMLAVRGPKITAASIVESSNGDGAGAIPLVPGDNRALALSSDGGAISEIKRYTTIERMGGYVQLRPNCGTFKTMKHGAYEVVFEPGNEVVQHLYQSKDHATGKWAGSPVHDGNCLRIHGALTDRERGILIHEASNVSWLIGCISPRNLGNFKTTLVQKPKANESYLAMQELFQFIGRQRANFFVLDW